MLAPRYLPLVLRQVVRRPTRSLLTMGGVAVAMFLFAAVQTMQHGVAVATETTANDTTLVVYRKNRFCPATSRLPENYQSRIAQMQGVAQVTPMKIVVSNCRTSLDVVTFRGVPAEKWAQAEGKEIEIIEGSLDEWLTRSDAALIGETLARRRNEVKVGQTLGAAGIEVYVAGILRSDEPQDQNVGYVHLDFLQQAANNQLGVVTQFNVKVSDASQLDPVATQIDELFATDQEPTSTSPEKSFVARAASDVIGLIKFTRILAWGCLAAVLALIGNAIVLSVQDRIKEHAVLQTLGYTGGLIARLIVAEGLLLGLVGGVVGITIAVAIVSYGQFSLSNEGLSIPLQASPGLFMAGLGVSTLLGVLAGLVPAWQAARRQISACLRAV